MARLLNLHGQTAQLATSAPAVLARSEVTRALEEASRGLTGPTSKAERPYMRTVEVGRCFRDLWPSPRVVDESRPMGGESRRNGLDDDQLAAILTDVFARSAVSAHRTKSSRRLAVGGFCIAQSRARLDTPLPWAHRAGLDVEL